MIVFWSKPYYTINVDAWTKTYSPYFKNVSSGLSSISCPYRPLLHRFFTLDQRQKNILLKSLKTISKRSIWEPRAFLDNGRALSLITCFGKWSMRTPAMQGTCGLLLMFGLTYHTWLHSLWTGSGCVQPLTPCPGQHQIIQARLLWKVLQRSSWKKGKAPAGLREFIMFCPCAPLLI